VLWNAETIAAFEACKAELANATLLVYPIEGTTLLLSTDASDTTIGDSLEQVSNDQLLSIAFYSKKLSDTQKKYSTCIESF